MQFQPLFFRNHKTIIAYSVATLILTSVIALINRRILELNAFRLDDISVSAASAHLSLDWVRKGFSDYFYPYPEFAEPITNFIRPVVNLFYFITGHLNFGMAGRLIVMNYACHALNLVILFSISKQHALIDRILSGVIFFLAPAFWLYPTPFSPAFGSEILAGTFIISALILVMTNRHGFGTILLAAALFTKEAALPFAAAMIVYGAWIRNTKAVILPALVLSGFMTLRYINFGSLSGGIYMQISALDILRVSPRIFEFPNFYVVGSELKRLIAERALGLQYLYIIGNVVSLGALAVYGWGHRQAIASAWARNLRHETQFADPICLAWLSCVFALLYFIIVTGFSRFSYTTLLAFLFALAVSPPAASVRALKFTLVLGHIAGFFNTLDRNEAYERLHAVMNMAAEKLKSHVSQMTTTRPVYIVNDIVTGYSRPSDFARLIRSSVDLRRGTSIDILKCPRSELANIRIKTERAGNSIQLGVTLPDCANFVFENTSAVKMNDHMQGDWLVRNDEIAYRAMRNGDAISIPNMYSRDSVTEITLITRVQNAEILYFDFVLNDWISITP